MKLNLFVLMIITLVSCKKKNLMEIVNGAYLTKCRYVDYEIGAATGYTDSTVYVRNFVTYIDIPSTNLTLDEFEFMDLEQPGVDERLFKVQTDKENFIRYENYKDPTPDGDPDTLSVEINLETLEIEIIHVGHAMFLFPMESPFSIIDYKEVCKGYKL